MDDEDVKFEYLSSGIEISQINPAVATFTLGNYHQTEKLLPKCDTLLHDGIWRYVTHEEKVIQQYIAGILAGAVVHMGLPILEVMIILQTRTWEKSVNQAIPKLIKV